MRSVDLVIEPHWIIPVEPQGAVLRDHCVVISEGCIVDVCSVDQAREQYNAVDWVKRPDHVLIPGLVNAHTHAAMTLLRGYADDLPLKQWLQDHIWPAEARWMSPDFVEVGTSLAIAEMLTGGITCFNDMYFFPAEAAAAARSLGIRMVVGLIVIDYPTPYASGSEECLAKAEDLYRALEGEELLSCALAPHAPYSVSESSWLKIAKFSDNFGLKIHTHVLETETEEAESLQTYGELPEDRLTRWGVFDERLIAAHMVHLSDAAISQVANAGVSVVHCPESNLKLANGFCPVDKLLLAGVDVGIGTDGAASNNNLDMFSELRTAALLSKGLSRNAESLPAQQALELATIGGARVLGLDHKIGSIEPGKQADLVAVSLNDYSTQPVYDPISTVVYSATHNLVSDVWVSGVQRVRDRQLVDVDSSELLLRAHEWKERIAHNI